MEGILLFSHGSLLCGAGHALDDHAARLRDLHGFSLVEVGYLNYSDPTFESGIESLVDAGADRIKIVPYFLVPGYFVTKSLPEMLDGIKERFPNVEFVVADAIGADDIIADALIDAASEATPIQTGWREAYNAAAADCRNREDCPLYGTSYCPATGS